MTTQPNGGPRSGQQLESLRRRNAAAVLGAVRTRGPLARSEIADTTGLSPTAVTKISAALVQAGYITESTRPAEGEREPGRPRVPVELDLSRHRFIGVHIGLQRVTVGLLNLAGEVVDLKARDHLAAPPAGVLDLARRLVADVLTGTGGTPVLGYSACCGGWVSPDDGVVREFTGLGWHDVPLRKALTIPGLPVPSVDSSVRALALAESRLGAARDAGNVLYLFAGNVMGSAHVLHGQIARGRDSAAGAIDHLTVGGAHGITCVCGRTDCLAATGSDLAVTTAATDLDLLPPDAHIEDVVALSQGSGERAAQAARLLARRAAHVGTALGMLLDLYDPDIAVVGGGVRLAIEHFPEVVTAARARCASPHTETPVVPSALVGPSALAQGAAVPALDAFFDDPLGAAAVAP
ncbi:ROK family transcriptional regulator [Streptomyces sp. NPDC047028]|uniref:ROK family transcriptional regulator n=1 Tax=Streptomyces sp. NPDC047028 TaxID=3155793 RepID=UPI0033EE8932